MAALLFGDKLSQIPNSHTCHPRNNTLVISAAFLRVPAPRWQSVLLPVDHRNVSHTALAGESIGANGVDDVFKRHGHPV